ncbi:MAG: hypothetical protein IPJ82_11415 [Lewinellaceae bacterium]|nr:hypothetical protein [Lewinellaceae bacterium]
MNRHKIVSSKKFNVLKMNKLFILTVGLAMLLSTDGFSQNFGFCNSTALLAQIPEIKAADSDLQAFQTQLTKKDRNG